MEGAGYSATWVHGITGVKYQFDLSVTLETLNPLKQPYVLEYVPVQRNDGSQGPIKCSALTGNSLLLHPC